MQVSTPRPLVIGHPHARVLGVIAAIAAVIAIGAWAFASHAGDRSGQAAALTPAETRYVQGMTRLTPAQITGAFGTAAQTGAGPEGLTSAVRRSAEGLGALSSAQLAAASAAAQTGQGPEGLTPAVRRFAEGLGALTAAQLAAASAPTR